MPEDRKNQAPGVENHKNLGGRPPYEVDYKTLEGLCRIHCTGKECAAVLGVKYETLDAALKRDGEGGFRDYYKKNATYGKASLRRWQWKKAQEGNPALLIFLGKQHLDQTDRVDNKSSDGSMTPPASIDVSKLDTETMEKILAAADRRKSDPE